MYFVTTVDSKNNDTRCVGYFKTFQEAEDVVLTNACDICETCYDYAVIEYIKSGLYQYDFNPTWYKWNKLLNSYTACEPPKFVNTVGFAIG